LPPVRPHEGLSPRLGLRPVQPMLSGAPRRSGSMATDHDWDGCLCRRCGKVRTTEHRIEGCTCRDCRRRQNSNHEWDGCVCRWCKATNPSRTAADHSWEGRRCFRCDDRRPDVPIAALLREGEHICPQCAGTGGEVTMAGGRPLRRDCAPCSGTGVNGIGSRNCFVIRNGRMTRAVLRWHDSTVYHLALGISREQSFHLLPILADALFDAGCDNEELMRHCRSKGPHTRGCWAIDVILNGPLST
jgi:hypothetical protein